MAEACVTSNVPQRNVEIGYNVHAVAVVSDLKIRYVGIHLSINWLSGSAAGSVSQQANSLSNEG